MYPKVILVTIFIFSSAFFVANLAASTVIKMDLKALVNASDLIVIGKVSKKKSFMEKGKILTSIVISPERILKGEVDDKIEIIQYGGRTETLITVVPGMPVFSINEHVLLFLEKPEKSKSYVVTGLSQGKFKVANGPDGKTPFVVPTISDMLLIPTQSKREKIEGVNIHDIVSPLDTFTNKIVDFQK